jgi:hypothetical protein
MNELNIDLIYSEYKRLVERYDKLLDSSFEDFKLYGAVGSIFTLIGFLEKNEINIVSEKGDTKLYFSIMLLLVFFIAIIAFRDLIKQSYVVHLSFNIKQYERYIRDKFISKPEDKEYAIFNLRESWAKKYFSLTGTAYSGFLIVFFIPILCLPLYLFSKNFLLLDYNPDSLKYGVALTIVETLILIGYLLTIKYIFNKSIKNEQ